MDTTIPRRRHVAALRRVGWLGVASMIALLFAGPSAAGTAATAVAPGTAPACGTVPLDVEIIIDHSGSMTSNSNNGYTREYWAQQAADTLITDLQNNGGVGTTANPAGGRHRVGVTTFNGTVGQPSGYTGATVVSSLGTNNATSTEALVTATGSGNTPFKAGMAAGAADLTNNERSIDSESGLPVTHVIVFLSDGRPNPDQGPNGTWATSTSGQRPTAAEGDAFKKPADAVYSIAIGQGGGSGSNLVDLGLMQLLAKAPGSYANVVDSSLLPTLFSKIFTEIACTANVTAVKSVSSTSDQSGATAQPGDTLSYSIALSNSGNSSLTGVSVSDNISGLLTYGSYVSGSADNDGSFTNPTVSWSDLTVPTSGLTLHFQVLLNETGFPVGQTTLGNTVLVTGTGSNCTTDTTAAACSTSTTVTIPGTANVTAVKSVSSTSDQSGATAQPGDTLSYSIALSNSGNSSLTGVSVSDNISGLLTYGSYVSGSADNDGSFTNPTVSWSDLTVPTSGLTLHFQVLLNETGFPVGQTTLGNTVLVTGTGSNCTTDTTAAACSTSTTVTIPGPSGLSITKGVALSASGPFTAGLSTTVGTTVYYEIVVTNTGNVALTDVTLVDDHTTLSDVCTIPTTLAVGNSITCDYSSSAALGLTTNTATAGASGLDSENASASVTASSPSCEQSGTCPTTPPTVPPTPTSPPCTPANNCTFWTPPPSPMPTPTTTPSASVEPSATPSPTSTVLAATSKPHVTPPPTATLGSTTNGQPASGTWLVLLALAGLLASVVFLTPVPARVRRRRR